MTGRKTKGKKQSRKLIVTVIVLAVFTVAGAAVFFMDGGLTGGLDEVSAVTKKTSPLTGQVYEGETAARPLIVSIDNVGDAVPQSWLSKADIVYEFPVEGRQTRLQAIYYGEFPEEFGPIRSTRPYFVDLAREYKGVFLAHGWSRQAKEYLFTGVVPYINAMNSGLPFYRVDDKEAPHNSYIKWNDVKAEIDARGWWDENQKVRAFKFLKGAQVNEGDAAAKISFEYTSSECEFTYDKESGMYTRTIGGQKYVDHETGKSIKVNNVLVQKVKSKDMDDKGRLEINMCAGGEAILFSNGVAVKGTWSREDLDSRTIFVDTAGNEFRLSPGQTWVEVADQNCDIKY